MAVKVTDDTWLRVTIGSLPKLVVENNLTFHEIVIQEARGFLKKWQAVSLYGHRSSEDTTWNVRPYEGRFQMKFKLAPSKPDQAWLPPSPKGAIEGSKGNDNQSSALMSFNEEIGSSKTGLLETSMEEFIGAEPIPPGEYCCT